jgi:hypothetical protein
VHDTLTDAQLLVLLPHYAERPEVRARRDVAKPGDDLLEHLGLSIVIHGRLGGERRFDVRRSPEPR